MTATGRRDVGWTLAAYAVAVGWLTWPLAAQVAERLPATMLSAFDNVYQAWALAWISHALATDPLHLGAANIYHPAPHALFYGPASFGAVPVFGPVYWASANPVLALNVTFLVGLVATAAAVHLVARRWTGSHAAGAVTGAALLTNLWLVRSYVPTVPATALLVGVPLVVLAGAEPEAPVARLRWFVPLLVLQSLVEPVYVAPALFVPLAVLATCRLVRRETRRAGLRLATGLASAGVLLLPVYAAYLRVAAANPDLARQSVWGVAALPPRLPSDLFPPFGSARLTPVGLALVGAGLVAVLVPGRVTGMASRAWRHAAAWTAAGIYLSLGSHVVCRGARVPMPHALLTAWLPVSFAGVRVPDRLGVVALVGLALLAGLAFAELVGRIGRGRRREAVVRVVAAAAFVVATTVQLLTSSVLGRSLAPFVTAKPPPMNPDLARALAAGAGPVLELPIGRDERDVGLQTRAMLQSTAHWRPLLNGYSSYWPVGFPERMALARRLPDAEALATLVRETGLRTLVVHLREFRPPERAAWLEAASGRRPDLQMLGQRGHVLLFSVTDAPP